MLRSDLARQHRRAFGLARCGDRSHASADRRADRQHPRARSGASAARLKQLAALVGLAPFNNDSGARRGQRSIRGGRKRVRDALYIAAFSAAHHAPRFVAFYKTLISAGKPTKLAIIAVARKLLTVLNAIVRDQQPFRA